VYVYHIFSIQQNYDKWPTITVRDHKLATKLQYLNAFSHITHSIKISTVHILLQKNHHADGAKPGKTVCWLQQCSQRQ